MHPFTRNPAKSVSSLGEERLIFLIRRWLGSDSPLAPFGIGDDCAVLPARTGLRLITVDPVIYRRHFDDTVPPRDVGAKLLKRNLSDLAAMGGRPNTAVLALTLDRRVNIAWLEQFYRGLAGCARRYDVSVVGGDVAQADGILAASLTLLGEPTGPRIVTRVGAQREDWIYVTGQLGRSRSSRHHYRFTPRLPEGAWLARQPSVRAMMDVSDGLAKDLRALTPRHAQPALLPDAIPRRSGATIAHALGDGEDYELVFALSRSANRKVFERRWQQAFPRTRLSCIGHFSSTGKRPAGTVDLQRFHGYEHLTGK